MPEHNVPAAAPYKPEVWVYFDRMHVEGLRRIGLVKVASIFRVMVSEVNLDLMQSSSEGLLIIVVNPFFRNFPATPGSCD